MSICVDITRRATHIGANSFARAFSIVDARLTGESDTSLALTRVAPPEGWC
jgi:hypothetical protein